MKSLVFKKYITLFLGCLVFSSQMLLAQVPKIDAFLNNDLVLIGDQITLTIEAEYAPDINLVWPAINEKQFGQLEVVEFQDVDTVSQTSELIKVKQQIILTSFDEGTFQIPPFNFQYSNANNNRKNMVRTPQLMATVQLPEIDEAGEIKANRDIIDVPITLKEMLPYFLAAILLGILLFALRFWWKRRKKEEEIIYKAPPRPAHEVAFEKLKELKKAKTWQQGDVKAYYTELTDIVREYIEGRFDIQALELTSDEIMTAFKQSKDLEPQHFKALSDMFEIADLVKFAKAVPSLDKHIQLLKDANSFVWDTKPQEILAEERVKVVEKKL